MKTITKQIYAQRRTPGAAVLATVQLCAFITLLVGFCCVQASAQAPAVTSVLNYATLQPGPVAAGSWAEILGTNLATTTTSATSVPLPRSLGGTTVQINGSAVPLFNVNPGAIQFQVPWELAGQSAATLTVNSSRGSSAPSSINVATYAPGMFTHDSMRAMNASDYTYNSPSNPAAPGSFIVIFCTGLGPVTNQPASGAAASTSSLSYTLAVPTATVGGVATPVLFSGLAPAFVGLYQVNIQVPANAPAGDAVPASLTIGGVSANTVAFAIGTSQPQLSVQPASLNFEGAPEAGSLAPLTLRVSNTGSGSLNWQAQVAGGSWLALSPNTGTVSPGTSASIQVTPSTSGLAAGTYVASITVQTTNGQQKQTTAVTLLVRNISQHILLSQTALVFTGVEGSNTVPPDSFGIINLGQGIMSWTASVSSTQSNWMSVSPATGSSDATSLVIPQVQVSPSTAGLSAGRYNGLVRIDASGADNSPLYVQVQLNVLPRGSDPGVQVRPTGLIFAAPSGSVPPAGQSVRISSSRPATQSGKIGSMTMSGEGWLTASSSLTTFDPSSPATVTVQPASVPATVDPSTDDARVHRGATVLLFDSGAQTVNVLFLTVRSAGTSSSGVSPFAANPSPASGCAPAALKAINRSLSSSSGAAAGWLGIIEVQVIDDCGNAVPDAGVVASFDNGDPPLPLKSLKNGLYAEVWRPTAKTAYVSVSVRAIKAPLAPVELGGITVAVPDTSSQVSIYRGGLVNAASFAPGQPLAPGSIISLFGRNLASGTSSATTTPLPTSVGGTSVMVGGKNLPLWFTSSGQLNAQLPFDLSMNMELQAIVTGPAGISVPEPITIAPARPGVFSMDQSGSGQGAIIDNASGKLVDASNPAKAGDWLQVYATGLGQVTPSVAAGQAAPSNPLSETTVPVTATIGGKAATVIFAGLAPGFAGLYQVNLRVPEGVTPGNAVPLILTQGGVSSNAATLAIR